jgi:hypothetical protein
MGKGGPRSPGGGRVEAIQGTTPHGVTGQDTEIAAGNDRSIRGGRY